MSVDAPISALSVPSVHPSDNEHQEIPDEIAGTNHGEIFLAKIVSKISDDITLTQCNVKLPEKTPCNSNGVKFMVEFLSGSKWVKFTEKLCAR